MDIGTRLDKAMKDAKIESQSQLARLSGVPQATISRILKGQGRQGPETVTLVALATALNINLRWLQEGAGPQVRGSPHAEPESVPRVRVFEPAAATKLQWVTEDEAKLLSDFRAGTEFQRGVLLTTAQGFTKGAGRPASKKA